MTYLLNQASYLQLRDIVTQNTANIVAWVGSGPSCEAGIPSWMALRNGLVSDLRSKAVSYVEGPEKQRLLSVAERATAESNLWVAFEMLKSGMGETSYRTGIASRFSQAMRCPLPHAYKMLWRMRLGGVLTLNIDKLVSRAFAEERMGRIAITEFTGRHVADYTSVLNSPNPFIGHLHGTADEHGSWVFTKQELRQLQNSNGYTEFITACFLTRKIVFIGISAHDIAVGGYLQELSERRLNAGTHFWITDHRDPAYDRWAEKVGIQIVRYNSNGSDHSELQELLDDLHAYLPSETDPIPIVPSHQKTSELPLEISSAELIRYNTKQKRDFIAARVSEILNSSRTTKNVEYESFIAKYDEVIHHAWYATTAEGSNELFDYKLVSEIASGAFGRVFTATDDKGELVAIKLLHDTVRNKKGWLQSFRRGIAAMRILTQHAVPGVVRLIDAEEMPAFAVMEYVEGPSLQEMVANKMISKWSVLLYLCDELSSTIKRAHSLPDFVLHRDIRPSNVIVKGGWQPDRSDTWNVVVLDFDLAWHKEAMDTSISTPGTGYIAPEQVHRESGISLEMLS